MPQAALYKVAYEEAVRALSEQEAVIDSLRSRAGVLFSAAAITTSFLGARTLHGAAWTPFSWLALLAFVGVATAFLAILWPRPWEFATNPHVVIRTYVESAEPVSIENLHRELSFHIYGSYLENRDSFGRLVVCFQIANVLFAVELMLWMAAIALIA
jgi:hypothetical protein